VRSFSTAIFFLVPRGSVSRLHRIRSAEVWHFYLGEPLTVYELDPTTGVEKRTLLGSDVLTGQALQHVVPAGAWFGSHLAADAGAAAGPAAVPPQGDSRDYALVGCTVAPGFDFADFEMAKRADMLEAFPHAAADP
jgi:predicted cupin superfamily sugar epimerase